MCDVCKNYGKCNVCSDCIEGSERETYLYDIFLDKLDMGNLVGTNGDETFSSKELAQADADDYIISFLAEEYNAKPNEFRVEIYVGK